MSKKFKNFEDFMDFAFGQIGLIEKDNTEIFSVIRRLMQHSYDMGYNAAQKDRLADDIKRYRSTIDRPVDL